MMGVCVRARARTRRAIAPVSWSMEAMHDDADGAIEACLRENPRPLGVK
jgi:hypothetical protein